MSRYPPSDYRPRDRSRSPPRFADRRPSAANLYDGRPPGPPRNASDAPRGPRSQFDGPRPPPLGSSGSGNGTRPAYTSLRDAPPLGSGDRGRPFRPYERNDRVPSPRERSPPSRPKDVRDHPPSRDMDITRVRRDSRDGPPSAGSNYSEGPSLASAPFRGGFARGRGRGDPAFRSDRGGRGNFEERGDLFRRERSPSKGWARDLSRDGREPERRDDRRFERREDERRSSGWADRQRDREPDRNRRDQPPPPRLEPRPSNESNGSANAAYQSSQAAPPINPARLALIESSGADAGVRRPSIQQDPPLPRDTRRDQAETPSYLNGRAETTANRYGSRGSSPPTQAPPVPAFTLSFAPPASSPAPSNRPPAATQPPKTTPEPRVPVPAPAPVGPSQYASRLTEPHRPAPPTDAPVAPRAPPAAPRAQFAKPPPAAPRGPRAHEAEDASMGNSRLQGVRSLENISSASAAQNAPAASRQEATAQPMRPASTSASPAGMPALPALNQPVSPRVMQSARPADLGAPTGPRASRISPAQPSVSPRPPFVSPRSDFGGSQGAPGPPRMRTPPPSAPTGPRNSSYSVSPKAAPTAPKANRGPPLAPRGPERVAGPASRAPERVGVPPWAPPSAPRSLQWNQWKRPGAAPAFGDQTIPAKRDFSGEEKGRFPEQPSLRTPEIDHAATIKSEGGPRRATDAQGIERRAADEMDVDTEPPKRQSSLVSGHSAAQSFFGQPAQTVDDEDEDTAMSDAGQGVPSTSEEDESDIEDENLTLFHAKFERQKRLLEAQMVDLSQKRYRATTPLESIARLARISARDLQRITEQREREMDIDDSPIIHNQHLMPRTGRSSGSDEGPDLLTPKGEEEHQVAIRESDDNLEDFRRTKRPSPEPVSLPYLLKDVQPPSQDSNVFQDNIKRHEETRADVADAMEDDMDAEMEMHENIERMFAEEYQRWREECEDLDRLKAEQEKLERHQSLEPAPEFDVSTIAPMNPHEGRRLHKHSSEYEIELVLKQSEETARIEQERQDREAKKNLADMEKEAQVPDQQTQEEIRRATFIDFNRYRDPESLTMVFSYKPPADNFTDNEQQIFIAAFKETPKKWGEIASLLPGRTYEDCIRHYYANKWDGRFRDNRTKKLKAGGRRGRGGARGPRGRVGGLMADLARAEDFLAPESMSEKGRPRRAAAPTTFAEKEAEAKATLLGPSPAKKPGPAAKSDMNGEAAGEKPLKRQKRTGDKPGRRGKANHPLAALAPQESPGKQYMPGLPTQEDAARAQKLEEASLLAGLQAGHRGMLSADTQIVYNQGEFMQSMPPPSDDPERAKPGPAGQVPPAKQSASSYWSVPEQNDFVKYIGYFGRDFAAIAAHMGTKTQTMIKNHYQRQVEGGNRPELERAAIEAEARRGRGDEMGPPPTPTPIVKRKYDNPQPVPQRPLAPHGEAMDADDSGPAPRAPVSTHTSPQQFQTQPRITTSAQNTPIPAPRTAPSPLTNTATPVTSSQASTSGQPRPLQPPFGGRVTFLSDTRSEPRPITSPAPGFRPTQDPVPRTQPSQQGRPLADAQDPQYIRNLVQEQARALRMQEQYSQADRMEQVQRQDVLQRNPSQGSPFNQPLHNPPERKPLVEEKPKSPPRSSFQIPPFSRPNLASSAFGPLGPTPFSSLAGRPSFSHPSPRREEPRPSSVSNAPPAHLPPASVAPSEPKRSNVMSLLNNDEEPKQPKRESLPSAMQRVQSPTSHTTHPTSAAPLSSIPGMRREPSFGQPSMPHSQFGRNQFGQQNSTPAPAPSAMKQETASAGGSTSHTPKPDWAARVLGQSSQPNPPTPTLEREVRPYYQHNHRASLLGSLNQPRANPSPPPLGSLGHSRTPSLTTQPGQQREQNRPVLPGQQHQQHQGSHQSAQPLQPNPYGGQQPPNFSQQQPGQPQSQGHHSHNNSLSGPFQQTHHRTISRDEHIRHEQNLGAQREREEQEMRWRQREAIEAEGRRREEEQRYFAQHRQQQQEQERQQVLRQPPQTLQPPFSGPPFPQNRNLDIRGQSRMETEFAMRQEQERQERQRIEDGDRRRQEALFREREEEHRRRQQEDPFHRRTPLGGGYGFPPPGPPRR
ncbi:hypothetical protein LTR37_007134 [Vermiconidia calcicola]|uniref:Uncharacterized protein n=1 Tax=Vermiconidia calcicola TaxID=1690605 RepID=A0ACC3NG27_9PEZI|nr:hypothetical protein LTR37_007134 [Vermiconidia calcicola]